MFKSINHKIKHFLVGRDFKVLLLALLGLIAVSSIVTHKTSQLIGINILFTIIFIITTGCLLLDKKLFYWNLAVGVLAMLTTWLIYLEVIATSYLLLQHSTYIIFFGLLLLHILKTIFVTKEINLNIVFATMCGYLLIGLVGCFFMMALSEIYPNAYLYNNGKTLSYFDFYYSSFVHLTTLGFGDIIPQIAPAKGLTIIHTIVGQLYLSVIMAIMVGKYITTKR